MKVAFIGQKGIPAAGGGVERYVEDVATRLAAFGHEVVVYTRPYYTPKLLTEYKGVTLKSLPSLRTKHLDAISHTFFSVVHACFSNVDVIHFQSIGPALLAWIPKILRPHIKIVSTLQSRDYEHLKWGSFARLMLKMGERSMCRFSDELIVVTENMRDYIRVMYELDSSVIPNGANLYEKVTTNTQLELFGLEKQGYIVAISRLVRHKGLKYLIEAYKQMSTDKKLVIVGTGAFTDEYVTEIKTLALTNPNIIFTGSQTGEALAELYSHAALFVQPSESEGLSLALLEAMSRQVPVLVSDIPANAEAVKDGGFVFENKNSQDLQTKMEWILSHKENVEQKVTRAREIIEKHYNWDLIVSSIEKIYYQALSSNVSYIYDENDSDITVVSR